MNPTAKGDTARSALRARQGKGARYDADEAPGEDLLLARRATAFFARKLNELDDADLAQTATTPEGWTRAHVVAAVAYDARQTALLLEPLCPSDGSLPPETFARDLPPLELAATLPPRALRHLFDHSAIHLDVCWRDLPGVAWGERISGASGRSLALRDLPRQRALLLWRQAIALGSGASLSDIPMFIRDLIGDEVKIPYSQENS
ncbi:maleylpyruvate isomerase N-terminal domain-containing protein [Sedimentitalea sp. XS_ASV28]|uniref:maleylpyruvate isomerase N-terminal domain-containing protein n=1 Tax=Sedimentitalea sp. XS_ASV28 TaxID=3241296 RepID=UPI0035141749